MKMRVTFRVAADLAEALRQLPNQTQFVERVLREALGRSCLVCEGRGRLPHCALQVSDFRAASLPPLDRSQALQLKRLVRLGRTVAATRLHLARPGEEPDLEFLLARGEQVLLQGRLDERAAALRPN